MPGTLHRAEKKRVSSEGRMDVAKVIRSVVIHGQPKGNVCLPHISDILEIYTIYSILDLATFHFHDLFSSTRLRKVGSEGRGKKDKSDTFNEVGNV